MADITTTYARQIPRPEDKLREQEEAERKESLQPTGLPPEELEGIAAFRAEFAAKTENMGGEVSTADPVNAAIAAAKDRAAENAAQRSLTPEQRQAQALADVLTERGLAPAPVVAEPDDLDYEPDEDQDDDVEAEYFTDEAGQIWAHKGGDWTRVDAEAQEGEYDALAEWSDSVDARSAEDPADEEDASDWGTVWDGSAGTA